MTDSEEIEKWAENHARALSEGVPYITDPTLPNLAKKYLPEGRRKTLDVGCGVGISANAFIVNGFDVTGLEQTAFGVQKCRERWPDKRFIQARGQQTHEVFKGEKFDLIYTIAVLQHSLVERKREIIQSVKKVLKDDGFLITAESCGGGNYGNDDDAYYHKGDPYAISRAGWVRLMGECGFTLVEALPNNSDWMFIWTKIRGDAMRWIV